MGGSVADLRRESRGVEQVGCNLGGASVPVEMPTQPTPVS